MQVFDMKKNKNKNYKQFQGSTILHSHERKKLH
jgi:hypothetical protein